MNEGANDNRRLSPKMRLVLGYALPALVALIAVQFWFEPGHFAAGGESGPFLEQRQRTEFLSTWAHSTTGSGTAEYQAKAYALPDLAILEGADLLGLDATTAQRILYSIVAVALVLAATFLVRSLVVHPWIPGGVGLLAFANPFVLQYHHSVQLWFIAVTALTGGLLLRAASGRRIPAYLFGLASIATSYLSVNPALLAVLVLWIVLLVAISPWLVGTGGAKRAILFLLKALPWCLILNLWWLVPFIISTFMETTTRSFPDFENISLVTFTHVRTSLTNVTTMNTDWAWGQYGSARYAPMLDGPGWATLRFGLPLVAFASPLFVTGKRRAATLCLTLVSLALILVGKGEHPPLTQFNQDLYDWVPGMWVLREPAPKLLVMIVLLYLLATGLLIEHLIDARKKGDRRLKALLPISIVLMAGTAIYPVPIWTGQLNHHDVRIPSEWYSIAEFVNDSQGSGKVLELPRQDFYQIGTTWNYYGVNGVPEGLLKSPMIRIARGGYFNPPEVVTALADRVQQSLVEGKPAIAAKGLQRLGVSTVIVRCDFLSRSAASPLPDPRRLNRGMRGLDDWALSRRGRLANVYLVQDQSHNAPIDSFIRTAPISGPPDELVPEIARLPSETVGVETTAQVKGNSPSAQLRWTEVSPSEYEVTLPERDSPFVLELKEAFSERWIVEGLEDPVEHFRVDGYANGWLLDAGESGVIRLRYWPDRWAHAAWVLSLIAVISLLLGICYSIVEKIRGNVPEDFTESERGTLRTRLESLSVHFGVRSFNEGKGILPTLDSLLGAARSCGIHPVEVMLSDSSQTTETVDSAVTWAKDNDVHLRVDRSETRRSAKEAIDVLYQMATSDLLVTVDADVLLPDDSLAFLLWDLTDDPQPEIAIGVVLAESGYRGTWARASAWQMKVTRRIYIWSPSDQPHAQGALVGTRQSFYSVFRYSDRQPDIAYTFSEDTSMARYLSARDVPTRNSWKAVALKVPTLTGRDFYLETHRAYAAVGGHFGRSFKELAATSVEGIKDPLGFGAYLYARAWAAREARRNPAELEKWPVAESTKR